MRKEAMEIRQTLRSTLDGLGGVEGLGVGSVVGEEVPEEHSVALPGVDAETSIREGRVAASLGSADVHKHCGDAVASGRRKT